MARYLYGGITDQKRAAVRRQRDAEVLCQEQRWRGAMYLLGYAIECNLKARLMEKHGARTIEELEEKLSRRFEKDVRLTGRSGHNIGEMLDMLDGARGKMDAGVRQAFGQCARWRTDWRYDPKEGNKTECEEFFEASERVLRFIARST